MYQLNRKEPKILIIFVHHYYDKCILNIALMKNINIKALILALLFLLPIVSSGQIIRTIAGNGDGSGTTGDGGPAINATMGQILSVARDWKGNIYIADFYYNEIRKVNPKGIISTFSGTGAPGCAGDGGPATGAGLSAPYSLTCDKYGNLFIADAANKAIRMVDTLGNITTVAGILCTHSSSYYNGDGIPAVDALIGSPGGVAVDKYGNIYIADANARVRKVTTDGIIHTVAGNGTVGYGGNGGCATCAGIAIEGVLGVDVDDTGNIYIAEATNNVIRKINTSGIINVFCGQGPTSAGSSGDGGPASAAKLTGPNAIRHDSQGNIYIADQNSEKIRMINRAGIITTIAGIGSVGYTGDGGAPTSAKLSNPSDITIDNFGNIFIADKGNGIANFSGHRIREVLKVDTMHITKDHSDTVCGTAHVTFHVIENEAHYWSFYKWKLNGVAVGSDTSAYYVTDTLRNGDKISCTKIDTAFGGMLLAVSDTVKMIVRPVVVPHLALNSTGDTVCAGQQVTLTANPVNGGSAPVYEWYIFSAIQDTTGPTFTFIPSLGDIVTCIMHSNAVCAIPDTAHARVTMYVNPSFRPEVTIIPKVGSVLMPSDTIAFWGQIISLFAQPTYGGTHPTFEWYMDDVLIPGADSNIFAQNYYTDEYIYCVMHSNAYCVVPTFDTSNIVHISIGNLHTAVNNVNSPHSEFSLSPNPNNGTFNLRGYVPDAGANGVELSVSDVLGKNIYTEHVELKGGHMDSKLCLDNTIPNGIYLLNIKFDGGSERIKFVVERR